jgi:hypothetical protein
MPDLNFSILGGAPVVHGLSPMLKFQLEISAAEAAETIQALILQCQIQIQPAQRSYSPAETERLSELFGPPKDWGRTLRNRLWAQASTTTGVFTGRIQVGLMVPCTYDMDLAATKYFYALDGDEIPLLFLFSGSVFYLAADGRLQVQPISWEKETEYRMPVRFWREALDSHYPNSAWLQLRKDVFDRLLEYRRSRSAATWEQAFEALLDAEARTGGGRAVGGPTVPDMQSTPSTERSRPVVSSDGPAVRREGYAKMPVHGSNQAPFEVPV